MNRNVLIAILFLLALVQCSFGQTLSTTDAKFPLPVVDSPINDFTALATPGYTLAATAATQLPALPAGTRTVYVCVTGGDVNFGGSTVAQGSTWPSIASGAFLALPVAPTKVRPGIYFANKTASGGGVVTFRPAN